jgi:hypothetical protein
MGFPPRFQWFKAGWTLDGAVCFGVLPLPIETRRQPSAQINCPIITHDIYSRTVRGQSGMSDEKEIKEVVGRERRPEKAGKYKPLPRNKQTERDIAELFDHGTERELMQFLRARAD